MMIECPAIFWEGDVATVLRFRGCRNDLPVRVSGAQYGADGLIFNGFRPEMTQGPNVVGTLLFCPPGDPLIAELNGTSCDFAEVIFSKIVAPAVPEREKEAVKVEVPAAEKTEQVAPAGTAPSKAAKTPKKRQVKA